MRLPRRVPWQDLGELEQICGWIYADESDFDAKQRAVNRVRRARRSWKAFPLTALVSGMESGRTPPTCPGICTCDFVYHHTRWIERERTLLVFVPVPAHELCRVDHPARERTCRPPPTRRVRSLDCQHRTTTRVTRVACRAPARRDARRPPQPRGPAGRRSRGTYAHPLIFLLLPTLRA